MILTGLPFGLAPALIADSSEHALDNFRQIAGAALVFATKQNRLRAIKIHAHAEYFAAVRQGSDNWVSFHFSSLSFGARSVAIFTS
jgi:hypothetical protein